jgi:hypothetical protein
VFQHPHRVAAERERRRRLRNALTIGPGEYQRAVVGHAQRVAALVQQPVMPAAQLHQVGQLRLAAVRPVLDVVCIHVAMMRAARKAAAAVAKPQGPADRRRHGACLAAHRQDLLPVVEYRHQAGLAAQPAEGLAREAGRLRILDRPVSILSKIQVHVHLVFFRRSAGPDVRLEIGLGQAHEGIGIARPRFAFPMGWTPPHPLIGI